MLIVAHCLVIQIKLLRKYHQRCSRVFCYRKILENILGIPHKTIDAFRIVSAHAPNSLVPRYLHGITLEGATFIRLPMHYTMEYEKQ